MPAGSAAAKFDEEKHGMVNITREEFDALSARIEAIEEKLGIAVKPPAEPKPTPAALDGEASVTTFVHTSALPEEDVLRHKLQAVLAAHPELRRAAHGRRGEDWERDEFFRDCTIAYEFLGGVYRRNDFQRNNQDPTRIPVDRSKTLSAWLDDLAEWSHRRGSTTQVSGFAFVAAVHCWGDIAIERSGESYYFGLDLYRGTPAKGARLEAVTKSCAAT
jgi:hypothetical protein